ncbi:MAG: RagB/SusD family nutrient uptake outer membrane protein [Bacteroidales bacterium]|nr:MAG: RagB/SusD family nutrient uptake outer membrane protein [Bacteroidales bacterium]
MKLNRLLILIILTLTTFSCEEVLDVKPSDKVSPEQAYSTIENFSYAVDGLYQIIRDGAMTPSFLLYPDILSDNCIMNFAGNKSAQSLFTWTYKDTDGGVDGIWANGYKVILAANMILERIEDFTGGTEVQRERVKAEALAIRALMHFQLVRYFGKTYSAQSSSDLGVPYITSSTDTKKTRSTVQECYNLIIKDLTDAKTLLVSPGVDRGLNTYISADAIDALLARIYLTQKDYTNAITFSTNVISKSKYALSNTTTFKDMWTVDNAGKEMIFKLKCLEKEGPRVGSYYTGAVLSEYVPAFEFYQLFANNDVRKAAYFKRSYISVTKQWYNFVYKYSSRSGVADGFNLSDIVICRLAEQYLIRAEAYCKTSAFDLARGDLNALRANRYTGFVDPNEPDNDLENAIALERRLELAFEGDRWFELQRQDLDIIRNGTFGDAEDGTGTKNTVLQLPTTSHLRVFPIPFSEWKYNPACEKNHGY